MLKLILAGLFVAVVMAGGAAIAGGTPPIDYGNSIPWVPPTNAAGGAVAGPSEDAAALAAQAIETLKAFVAAEGAYSQRDYARR